jgi:spore germination protein GerM
MMKGRWVRLLLGIILATAMVLGCVPASDNSRLPEKKADSQAADKASAPDQLAAVDTIAVKVYFGSHDAKQLEAEVYQLNKSDLLLQRVMEIMVAGPRKPDLWPVVPALTKVNSVILKERTAYVDFSDAIVQQSFGGSSREILAVGAIVNTLTEFPEVKLVQILVEGEKVNSLFGHVDVSLPMSRSPGIIKGE